MDNWSLLSSLLAGSLNHVYSCGVLIQMELSEHNSGGVLNIGGLSRLFIGVE